MKLRNIRGDDIMQCVYEPHINLSNTGNMEQTYQCYTLIFLILRSTIPFLVLRLNKYFILRKKNYNDFKSKTEFLDLLL